jgi:hypothetical protein
MLAFAGMTAKAIAEFFNAFGSRTVADNESTGLEQINPFEGEI